MDFQDNKDPFKVNKFHFCFFRKITDKIDFGKYQDKPIIDQEIDNDVDTDEEELRAVKQRVIWNITRALESLQNRKFLL